MDTTDRAELPSDPPSGAAGRGAGERAVLLVVFWVAGTANSYLAPLYPVLARRFGVGTPGVSWMVIAFTLSLVAFTPVLSKLADLRGHSRMLRVSAAVFALGTVLAALAPSFPVLLAGLVLQGALAGVHPSAFGYLRRHFDPGAVSRAIAHLIGALMLGICCGTLISGATAALSGGAAAGLWVEAVLAVAAAGLSWALRTGAGPVGSLREMDWSGAGLLILALTAVVVGLGSAPGRGWARPDTLGCLIAGAVLLVAWFGLERHLATPLIDVGYLFRPRLVAVAGIAFALHFGFDGSRILLSTFPVLDPRHTGYGLGLSPATTGIVLATGFVVAFLASASTARVGQVIGYPATMSTGAALSLVCFLGMSFVRDSLIAFTVLLILGLLGFGLIAASVRIVFVQSLRPGEISAGEGVLELGLTTGAALGSAAMAATLNANPQPHTHTSTATGYTLAWGLAALLALAALVTGIVISTRDHRAPAAAPAT